MVNKIIRDKKGRFVSGYRASINTEFKKGVNLGYGFKKKNKSWCKGLTRETNESLNTISKKMKGKNNPMYGKFGKEHHNFGKKFSKELYPNFGWRVSRKNQIFPLKDSSIELKIQNFLTKLHIEYFTHKYISEITHSYQCDILIPIQEGINQKTIIEADGCYWHGCPICNLNKNIQIEDRINLDKKRTNELIEKGYRVIRIWGHEIRAMELNDLKNKLQVKNVNK